MKPGDYVRYRDRKSTDPDPPGAWGETGIVIRQLIAKFDNHVYEHALEYMNADGDFITARVADLKAVEE